jgi:hypothetical protein
MTSQSTEHHRTAHSTATADRNGTISATYRRLRILGFDEREAGNLSAYVSGIAIGPQPWTVRELTHVLFMREMYRVGRGWSGADDRAAAVDGARLPIGEGKPLDPDASDGRVTLLTFFRGMSGPGANLEQLAPPAHRDTDVLGDRDREGG